MVDIKRDAELIAERMGGDDALRALTAASRDMLKVWEGVAHRELAYRPGSPAARIKNALRALDDANHPLAGKPGY
jgi:hypothetical protein